MPSCTRGPHRLGQTACLAAGQGPQGCLHSLIIISSATSEVELSAVVQLDNQNGGLAVAFSLPFTNRRS